MSDAAATGAAVAIVLAAFKVLEVLVVKISNGRGTNGRDGMLKRIYEVVTKEDGDGAPMIYGAAGHREILAEMRQTNTILARIERNGAREP